MIKKYKKLIIAVIVIVGGFFIYNSYFNTESQSNDSLTVTTSADVLGSDIIRAINQINALKLDRSIFNHSVFKTLVDRSEEIEKQEKSRPNPFAPVTDINFTVNDSENNSNNTDLNFETEINTESNDESPLTENIPSGL
jgi:hypothetical protein